MTKKLNKSKAFRDYAKAHPDARNKDISAALAKKGIVLSADRISVMKAKDKAQRRAMRTMMNEVAVSRRVGLAEITVALSLLALTGGVEKANRALAAAKNVIVRRNVVSPEVRVALSLLELTGRIEGANAAVAAAQEIRAAV